MENNKKTVLLGISGGIAAYKTAYVASGLKKRNYNVHAVMTKHACEFISPLTFETLTENRVCVDTFDRNFEFKTQHISLAKAADLVLIAPATANVIAKLANGIADDMLTTTVLACTCPKVIAPAMNTAMYENIATQVNLQILRDRGWTILDPAEGLLACGDIGKGKMPEPDVLISVVEQMIAKDKDMAGLNLLVTAGPTQEAIDPVRYITNHSTGKMGYAIARMAARRGANVTLVSGRVALPEEPFVETVKILSAQDMFDAVTSRADQMDIIIKAAAVADYRPATVAKEKIKKKDGEDDAVIRLDRTQDILKWLGEHRHEGQFLCGFAMETENVIENSRKKLSKKNVDMICANSLRTEGAGFAGDTNIITMITAEGEESYPRLTKEQTADVILDKIMAMRKAKD
ncbi:MAG: bifunctional phosphopantothenoylcysteine decarboxylase/phosphopantothenate--cysteine ligase CoaBC [Firmicutes bacterium]|nr:bifunctional phosphopantothenoylcysteine decarboxylase/phosphopantothenate--cysteine ligase CoaBC [Bacillota bacterium]MBQ3964655.1 bifunctional phosphopantothenoylcysteine decarboxylase/phosphopantothenate--cysteine ligase CoaBC [Bacillota bacterium]